MKEDLILLGETKGTQFRKYLTEMNIPFEEKNIDNIHLYKFTVTSKYKTEIEHLRFIKTQIDLGLWT